MSGPASRAGPAMLGVFIAATLAGSTLVFLVQPMAAKLLLPTYGGSPAVWTTSLLFFQASLLIGYAWAHVTTRRLSGGIQPVVQLGLLGAALLVLPLSLPAWASPPDGVEPALWLLLVLVAAVGLPYVAVTTSSPVLQRWFSLTDHPWAHDPYFLYAAGNAGSLGGLLAYPLIIEPNLSLVGQAWLWALGYFLFLGLTASIVLLMRRRSSVVSDAAGSDGSNPPAPAPPPEGGSGRPLVAERLGWIALAFVPSSLMLGTTTFITSDLAAVPLLWVLPLGLYLVTFILAFSPRNPLTPRRMAALLPFAVVVLAVTLVGVLQLSVALQIAVALAVFFVAALLAHGRLAAARPPAARLTEFYFLLAVGGALGGIFNALVAPLLFESVLEYPLAVVLALLVRPGPSTTEAARERRDRRLDLIVPALVFVGSLTLLAVLSRLNGAGGGSLALAIALAAVASLVLVRRPVRFALTLGGLILIPMLVGQGAVYTERSFYGVNRVVDQGEVRLLVHGTTSHGGQLLDPGRAREPLTYYHRDGPFGVVMSAIQDERSEPMRIGVIGLGTGGIAAYLRPGDEMTYFEIDPAVIRIAEDPRLFTFLSGAPERARVVLGDGRVSLAAEPDASYDLLVLDAFSGDATPAHLLTLEAIELYRSKLTPGGVMAFNVSNRYIDVGAVVEAGLVEAGTSGFIPDDPAPGQPPPPVKEPAGWVVASDDPAVAAWLRATVGGREIERPEGIRPWTDDFSDLLSVIRG